MVDAAAPDAAWFRRSEYYRCTILDYKPGLPIAFEIVYLVFELLSLVLMWIIMVALFHPAFGVKEKAVLIMWSFSVPLSLAAVFKSIAALILEIQDRLPVAHNFVSIVIVIALAALLFFYDITHKFFSTLQLIFWR